MNRYIHIFIHSFTKLIIAAALLAIANSAVASNSVHGATHVNGNQLTGHRSVLRPVYGLPSTRLRAENNSNYRSKREVVAWVKRQHDADVLKITFNPRAESYRIKILTARGKVRFLTVSAKR